MPGAITAGMDIQSVRTLATEMTRAADEITQVMTRVTARLQGTPWLGQDRTKFEQDWNSRQTAQLKQVATALQDAAKTATQNAQDQEATSNR